MPTRSLFYTVVIWPKDNYGGLLPYNFIVAATSDEQAHSKKVPTY